MDNNKPYWEVTSVKDNVMYGGPRGVQPSKIITVKLNTDGSTFNVEVPSDQFNAQYVQQMIEEQAGKELDVRDLKGPAMQ